MKCSSKIFFSLFFCSIFFYGCSSTVRYTSRESEETVSENYNDEAAELIKEENINVENFNSLETQVGTASYYADEFNGKKTASGEVYNMNGFSAAHITYPIGTIVKVTNLLNHLSIILRINDRMPNLNGRVIDLSLGAAQKLNMVNSGTAKVKIEVIKWGKGG